MRILNSEVLNTKDDGIYINSADGVEIGYTYVHHVNQNWSPGASESFAAGDGIQLEPVANWWVHHNTIDSSDTGNKFCFISNKTIDE